MKENELVKIIRESERKNQAEFAEMFNYTNTAISLMESGKRGVSSKVMNYCLEHLKDKPLSRKEVIRKTIQNAILNYNSFVDEDGHNRFEHLIDDLNDVL